MARPKKPLQIHKMQGTLRKDRHGDGEGLGDYINQETGYPDPPEMLQEWGRRTWVQIMQKAMVFEEWLSWDELPSLVAYCGAVDVLYSTTGRPHEDVDDKGNKKISVDFKAWKDACLMVDKFATKFGLDPSSKNGFNFGKKPEVDEFADFKI